MARPLSESLRRWSPPVPVCLPENPPEKVPATTQPAAAGCVFWERGAQTAFVTSPADHSNCVVGMYTHHMPLTTAAQHENLDDCLKVFGDLGYVRSEDLANIPVLKQEAKYVTYAPLAATPVPPAAVLLFANRSEERRVGKECRSRWSPY